MEFGADYPAHSASERIEVVQPHSRPLSDIGVGDRDTTGSREDGREERVEQDGDLNGRPMSSTERMMRRVPSHQRKAEVPRAP